VTRGQQILEESVAKLAGERLLNELEKQTPKDAFRFEDIADLPSTKEILSANARTQMAFVRATVDRVGAMRERLGKPRKNDMRYMNLHDRRGFPLWASFLSQRLLRRNLPWTSTDLAYLVNRTADLEMVSIWCLSYLPLLVKIVEKEVNTHGLTKEMKTGLARLSKTLEWEDRAAEQKMSALLATLAGGPKQSVLDPGEAWSDAALADLKKMKSKERQTWEALLGQCAIHNPHKPSDDWLENAKPRLKAVGFKSFKSHLKDWSARVGEPGQRSVRIPNTNRTDNTLLSDQNADVLRGLVWCCPLACDASLSRMLADLAAVCFAKIPGRGQRSPKVGNACVYSLGELPDTEPVAQLGRLRLRVKNRLTEQLIDNALIAAATHRGMSKEELEEIVVPAYGLTEVGVRREQFGEFTAELLVAGMSSTELRWYDSAGKERKSVPAGIRTKFAGDLQELKFAAKDIQKTLPVQRGRLEQLFLRRKSWNLETWRERYLQHPLVGTLVGRLIWQFSDANRRATGIWHQDRFVDALDRPLARLRDQTTVQLWHPLDQDTADVLAWRAWLEDREVRQPFKQAHREIYCLTDAERQTRVYSNRFAAHILKQHQFNALCVARSWKYNPLAGFDEVEETARLELPAWNLRAEFSVDLAGEVGHEMTDASVYLYVATDQVRFYQLGEPEWMPLDQVPPLVFSEVMRDVDLFVGVASVGNDPNWVDGGPAGRYRDYWQSYSFGDLPAMAQTRKAVLERIIPRLKIADRCSFADRWLMVRGDLHTYKIHLGSGNILMSPNDQYLCIVPKQATAAADRVFLPFEGDTMLSIILSKALLLAEDSKIKDQTIVRQIRPQGR
jgi:hypothetical protein